MTNTPDENELDFLDTEDDDTTPVKFIPNLIPSPVTEAPLIEVDLSPDATFQEVRSSDIQISNVQILSLLHGLSHVRTVNGLCQINEQISKTLRYRRDILGMEKEREYAEGQRGKYPILPLD